MSASKRYRALQNKLANDGILIHIQRIRTGKEYHFIENFQITKVYKTRKSCNKRILRLLKLNNVQELETA